MNHHFARGARAPAAGETVVYVAGAFDLFHAGHAAFLEAARALGDYLLVGGGVVGHLLAGSIPRRTSRGRHK